MQRQTIPSFWDQIRAQNSRCVKGGENPRKNNIRIVKKIRQHSLSSQKSQEPGKQRQASRRQSKTNVVFFQKLQKAIMAKRWLRREACRPSLGALGDPFWRSFSHRVAQDTSPLYLIFDQRDVLRTHTQGSTSQSFFEHGGARRTTEKHPRCFPKKSRAQSQQTSDSPCHSLLFLATWCLPLA